MGAAPTLSQVKSVYGDNVAESWLSIQLNDINEYTGTSAKMDINQMNSAAQTFAWKYHYLKLTEWMLFFQLFKSGEFGHFFGSVDVMKIGEALQAFLTYRANKIDQYTRMDNTKKISDWRNDPNNISYDEFERKQLNKETK